MRSFFLSVLCGVFVVLPFGVTGGTPDANVHGSEEPPYKEREQTTGGDAYAKEARALLAELKREPDHLDNCGIYPFSKEELGRLGGEPEYYGLGSKELEQATQERILNGLRNVTKFVRESKADLNGVTRICIGPEFAGPTLERSLVLAWNATPDQLKKELRHLPTKEEFDASEKAAYQKVKQKIHALVHKYGISIAPCTRILGDGSDCASLDSLLPLLDSLDHVLAKKKIQGKKIDALDLITAPTAKKVRYREHLDGPEDDRGIVALNTRVVNPSEVEAALSGNEIPDLPTPDTFTQLDHFISQTTDPLLKKQLTAKKAAFAADHTLERREKNKRKE